MALLQPTQTTDGGSGSGSLRDLILQANSSPEDDIIELQGGETYTLSLENAEIGDENQGETGDLDLANNGTLTIRGVGEGKATIDASSIPEGDRVFDIQDSSNLTLENLIVTGGNVSETGAGGIGVRENAFVTINNSTISGNASGDDGGGIYVVENGKLDLNNSIVENNTASEDGGGIKVRNGEINLNNSQISNNSASRAGGGIAGAENGEINLNNSQISNNSASRAGGGIAVAESGEINLNNSQINSNSASEAGGGIAIAPNATANISQSIISNNSSVSPSEDWGIGGGIFNNGNLNIIGSTISENTASHQGGGISSLTSTDIPAFLAISNSNLENNISQNYGGGILVSGNQSTAEITNNDIINNQADADGGGVIFGASQGKLFNNYIADNSANNGAGIRISGASSDEPTDNPSNVELINNTIANNSAIQDGGGTAVDGIATFINNTISGNSAGDSGGGVAITSIGEASFNNDTVTDNSADDSGGGIDSDSTEITLANTIIANSTSGEDYAGETPTLEGVNLVADGSVTGENVINADPLLNPLEDNGNGTLIHTLQPNSPALDAGDNDSIAPDVLDLDADGDVEEATPVDQLSNQRIFNNTVDLGAYEFFEEPEQTIDLFRLRNTTFDAGTYIFVGADERDAILDNPDLNQTFELEGDGNVAFTASTEPGDDLIPFYRLRSLDVPGTYLFVTITEYDAIFDENSEQQDKWEPEGLDREGNDIAEFYLLDSSADRGIQFNRFQNTQNGTFLYAGPTETEAIENNPSLSDVFINQGVAFESLI